MRYLTSILLCLAALLPLKAQNNALATQNAAQTARAEVLLETTEGNIRIALYNETPRHRDNFLRLVDEHFYDSLLFHRVISNFMIQAGDPDSRHAEPGAELGEGDLGYTIEPEFRLPDIFHRRGVVAAARCWQENATTVFLAGELAAIDTILRCPFVGAVVSQLVLLLF